VDQGLETFLAAGDGLRLKARVRHAGGEVLEAAPAAQHGATFLAVPAGVTLLDVAGERAVLDHRGGCEQAARADVHAADVGVEQVGRIKRLAPDLGVEIEPAGPKAAGAQDVVEGEGHLGHTVGELIRVPAGLHVAAVYVDRA
jgi:hypothetical protein